MKRAFTLIELLVVIAIIAILAAILFPVFAQAKDAAKNTALLSNTKQLATGSIMYATDYDDLFAPTMASSQLYAIDDGWQILIQPYVKNLDLIRNPKRDPFNTGYLTKAEHFGMTARSATSMNATVRSQGYYSGTHDGQAVRYEGIGGFVNLNPDMTDWLGRFVATSYSTTAIEDPSGSMMLAESNFWDQGMPRLDATDPAGGWCLWSDAINNWAIEGVTATTKPSGTNASGVTGCYWQDGRSTVAFTDSSARAIPWRTNFYAPRAGNNTTFMVIKTMNPMGW